MYVLFHELAGVLTWGVCTQRVIASVIDYENANINFVIFDKLF